ncbi:MAG TPA: hypothetical protein VF613_06315 [Longimicrobium sp.]|jgi:hypothetical protein
MKTRTTAAAMHPAAAGAGGLLARGAGAAPAQPPVAEGEILGAKVCVSGERPKPLT